jgi:hypothetical protein
MDEEEEEPDQWGGLFDDEDQPQASQEPQEPQEPPEAYSVADPAYGPPDALWYERRQREREEEEIRERAAAEDSPQARGPFEPPPKPEPDPWGGLLDGEEADFSRDPLGQVTSMYQTAESLGDDKLDRRFEELLERQRSLIGAFLQQSRPEFPERVGDVPVTAGSDARGTS